MVLVAVVIVGLFVGTLMPGGWRDGVVRSLNPPIDLSITAHVLLFATLALLLPSARPGVMPESVLALSLVLAFLTEGLQFFAIDRHPGLVSVGYDMAGASLGLIAGALGRRLGIKKCGVGSSTTDPFGLRRRDDEE